jgi:Bax protein
MVQTKLKILFIVALIISTGVYSCRQETKEKQREYTKKGNIKLELKKDLSESNQGFLFFIVPLIKEANQQIAEDREKILGIKKCFDSTQMISKRNTRWLSRIAGEYRLDGLDFSQNSDQKSISASLGKLLNRVDIVPLELVTAQACVESEWGRSRFASEANNFFGVHCYTRGCGIPPKSVADPTFEVKKYGSAEDGIEDYLWIINTGNAYEKLRNMRAEMREKGIALIPTKLTEGLGSYSERGQDYIDILDNMIIYYLPHNLEDIS